MVKEQALEIWDFWSSSQRRCCGARPTPSPSPWPSSSPTRGDERGTWGTGHVIVARARYVPNEKSGFFDHALRSILDHQLELFNVFTLPGSGEGGKRMEERREKETGSRPFAARAEAYKCSFQQNVCDQPRVGLPIMPVAALVGAGLEPALIACP